ncbi:capping protein, Arp2/3 and myosin-I linker protein 3-like isoform X1 [Bufo bufo]|uniref:capping protein, Arp2/3 and myosin-I linker protein 3-like isoform X1 n=1 Tax=Bufo bufo TaxID=8384 RepID=UPI001ABDDE17|nr:capping protein, Arp2/3 and myosin-I linker protein 3-like isoform X1 [Bufo bufo]
MQAISYELQAYIADFFHPRQVMLIKPIQLKMKSQSKDLALVLTSCRGFMMHNTLQPKVESTFSYLEITAIDIQDLKLAVLETDTSLYPCQFMSVEDLEQVLIFVMTAIKKIFPDSSPGKIIRKNPDLQNNFTGITDHLEDFTEMNQGPCGGFSETYAALCDYNGFTVQEEIQWDIDNIYHSQESREFRLLDFIHLDASDVALAVTSLSFNQWFTKLHCKDIRLRPEISEKILYVLGRSKKIEELVLENCGLKCEFAIKMAQTLDNNSSTMLHTMNLSGNQIEDRGMAAISQHFEQRQQVLQHLSLARISVTAKGISSLFQCLALNDSFSKSLYHLDLSGNPGIFATEHSTNFFEFLIHCTSLCYLNLSGTDCDLNSLFESLHHGCCLSLSCLNAARNVYSHRKIKDLSPITKFFNKAFVLKHLNLSGTQLPSDVLRAMFQGLASNGNLCDLHMDLSNCELRSSGAQVIQDMIFDVNSVRSLDISGNGFTSEMVTLILSVGRSKSIKHLSLGKNFNSKFNTSVTDVLHRIVQLLQDDDCAINSLCLADSRLKSGTNIILNALKNINNLTKLDISGNLMGDHGAKLLAKALHVNRKLRTLIWDRNNTTCVGFLDVAHALTRNFTLMAMPLPMTDISQAYRVNPGKTEDALQQIQNYLLRNNQLLNTITGITTVSQEVKAF